MDGWEFRLSDDRRTMAFYDPGNGPWFVPVPNMRGKFIETTDIDRVADHNGRRIEWTRFLPKERAAAEVMKIVEEFVVESNDVGGLDCNDLVSRLEAAGYTFPEEEEE